MNTRKLVGLAGSVAVCLATGRLLVAGAEPSASRTASPLAVLASAQIPGAPAAPAGAPPIPGGAGAVAAPGAAPAAAPPKSLWTFLGVPSCDKIHETCQKLKELLGVPPAAPPLGGAAAANSPTPAVKAAAAAKAEVDAKPAKIKAIRYLANLENACCYPGVKDALLAALDDCDWEVRREAAAAFGKACCCEPDVLKRLKEIVNKRDAHGRYVERVDDVRCAAEKSLNRCLCQCGALPEPEAEAPKGTPEGTPESEKPTGVTHRNKSAAPLSAVLVVSPDMQDEVLTLVGTEQNGASSATIAGSNPDNAEATTSNSVWAKPLIYVPSFKGSVVSVDKSTGLAYLEVLEGDQPMVGTHAQLYHRYPIRTVHVGEVEVIGYHEGRLIIRPGQAMSLQQIKKGDKVVGGQKD